jgi:hypothetical protein
MSTNLSITGQLRIAASWVDDLSATTVTDSASVSRLLSLVNGTGAGQVNGYWRDVRTVAGSATDTIDTTDLPLSVFGTAGTLNLASVKLIYVRNQSTTVTLTYDIDGTNCGLPPGAVFLWNAGTAPTAKWFEGDDIVIEGGSASATYEIILAGVKAT